MNNEFTSLNLHPQLVQAVTELGFESPTPIQSAVIPVMLAGQDVIGQAQTGTGKTAAFALPLLHNLNPDQSMVKGLVLAPTRELAQQVSQAIYAYGRHLGVRVLAVYGGQPYGRQINRLQKGVDVVVGTPGRLLDLIRQKALDLSAVETVILDEADEMLSMGFIEDIEAILSETPAGRQTTLFSATLPAEIRRLAEKYMSEPQSITTENKQMTVAAIEQRAYLVNEADKLAALTRLFEVEEITSGLIFARTRVSTGELANELTVRGFPAEALNGDLNQDTREQVLERFRQNQIKVLVATDVAARGLDIDDISHVFNYDLPYDPEIYVHRIGRTGRAGKTGIAITLFSPNEQRRFQRIESYTRQRITRAALPTVEEIQAHREGQLMQWLEVWLKRGRSNREKEIISRLVEAGHDPLDVAAAALKIARAEEKQRPIAPIGEIQERPSRSRPRDEGQRSRRSYSTGREERGNGPLPGRVTGRRPSRKAEEKGMVRLTLSAGKAHGVRPADIVGSIAYHAEIPGHTIGAIHIQEEHTLFDVPQQLADQVLDKAGSYKLRRQPVMVSRI